MMEYKIENSIPIPTKKYDRDGICASLRKLKIGESVWIKGYSLTLNASVRAMAKWVGIKYVTRKEEKDGVMGLRVWRRE